ncbi:hypothetical protein TTHERM_01295280 (macronuclear) [Tetrahymena thermophila SB210]|uniref:Uncharacterized protein n=1 Tax=Tetrahymena thermophila (strain SB210) TaxID=312017 RepID=Q23VB7_TETTS|nr:hypothetical protein TTHERM_01295280 [Tetrahymena thermophila SB210]EAS00465.1 hypothetical protein TTHERM_01295280 [Tetrahymena thermophila SB210]|eukprot:XP_001020710.1 hypothetical protein TTHERM_01295280 [Tetrahymena thermophila SB210]
METEQRYSNQILHASTKQNENSCQTLQLIQMDNVDICYKQDLQQKNNQRQTFNQLSKQQMIQFDQMINDNYFSQQEQYRQFQIQNQPLNYQYQCSINSSTDTLASSQSSQECNYYDGVSKFGQVKQENRKGSGDSTSDQIEGENEMGVEYDDYTNVSYQYPEYNEQEEKIEEENNKIMIERLNKQQTFVFSMDQKENSDVEFKYLPLNKILTSEREFYMYGDIILERNYSYQDEKAVNSFCHWKYINSAETKSNFVKILANNKSCCAEDFNQVIQIYRSYQNQDIYEITQLLEKFSFMFKYLKQGLQKQAEYIEMFSKYQMLMKRQQLFEQLSDEYLCKIPQDKFFLAIKIQPNFKDGQIEGSRICFSRSLLKLVNMPEEKFINLILRNKAPEFFGWQLRLMFLRNKLSKFLRKSDEEDFLEGDLLTRDGLRIPSKVKKEVIRFNIDQLIPELTLEPFQETLAIYYFEIDQNTLNQISYMRNNYNIEELSYDEEDFYTYSLETQAFLELYYSNINCSSKKYQKKKQSKKASEFKGGDCNIE